MISPEQAEQIKKQLIEQISSTFPEDKKRQAIDQVKTMNSEQLEEFLVQNNLIKGPSQESSKEPAQQCIFCSIIEGNIESYKIDENKASIAILEINPASKGHVIIIPKEHVSDSDKIPQTAFSLAKKIAKKLKSKLKAKEVLISSSKIFDHMVINVLPVYENETLDSERQKAEPKDLEKLKKLLEKKSKPKIVKVPKIKKIEYQKLWLPKRIP